MNPVIAAARETGLTLDQAMNILQDLGIVSDLCVRPEDISVMDRERAARWLRERPE